MKAFTLIVLLTVTGCAEENLVARRHAVRTLNAGKRWRSAEGFQSARWGMTEAEVRSALPGHWVGSNVRTEIIDGEEVVERFGFCTYGLARVVVSSPTSPERQFNRWLELLTGRYGNPDDENDAGNAAAWARFGAALRRANGTSNAQYALDVAQADALPTTGWGYAHWDRPETFVRLGMDQTICAIVYTSRLLATDFDQSERNKL